MQFRSTRDLTARRLRAYDPIAMQRDWLSRALDRADPETLAARLDESLARGAWAEVFELVRRLAPHRPYDVRLLNLGARAASRITDRETPRRLQQAASWLQHALELAPGDVETLYQLGRMAHNRRLKDAAEDYWHRAWTASPDDAEVREALLGLWAEAGELPDWGAEALEQMLLARHHDDGWRLLLAHYHRAGRVSAAGHRLLLRRFQQGDRTSEATRLLAQQLRGLDRFDASSLPVYLAAVEYDAAFRTDVVRCDARLRQFEASHADWYLEAAADGMVDAALLVVRGWQAEQLSADQALPAMQVAARTDEAAWGDAGLNRAAAIATAAGLLAGSPTPEALPLLQEALSAAPEDLPLLRAVCRLQQPSLAAEAVEHYLRLFELEPDSDENTGFLAEAIAKGQLTTALDEAILATHLERHGRSAGPVVAALAGRLTKAERDDPEAVNWLTLAAETGVAGTAEVWLARVEARHGDASDEARERWARFAADHAVSLDARLELAAALAETAPTVPHLVQLAAIQAASGAGGDALVALATRLPAAAHAGFLDQAARERFAARDWLAATALTKALVAVMPGDPGAVAKHRAAAARLAMTGGANWPESGDDRLSRWIRAAAGQTVDDAALADALTSTGSPILRAAAAVLDGREPPPLEPRTEMEAWLASLLASESAPRGLTEPEPRLWQAWQSGPTTSASLAVLRQTAPPWPVLQPVAADHAVREAPWQAVEALLPKLSSDQRLAVEARRIAELADHGDGEALDLLTRWAPVMDRKTSEALRLAVAGTLATPEALAAAPETGPGSERVNWLRALQAWSNGEPAGPFLDRLPAEILSQPEVAWTIAAHEPHRAYAALSRALQANRDRVDLLRGLCHQAALNGDVTRAQAWAASLRDTPMGPAAEVAVALLTEPWDEPPRWAVRLMQLAGDQRSPLELALGAAALTARAVDTPSPDGLSLLRRLAAERGLGGEVSPDILNLQAATQYASGNPSAALATLERLTPLGPAGHHNAAVAAEAAGDPAAALRHREAELAARADAPEPWQVAARRKMAELAIAGDMPDRAVAHLTDALALRPDDATMLGMVLTPLLTLGQADEALALSERRLEATPELAARLDHATVLASAEGAPAAAAWLDHLAATHPEAAEAVAERRGELAERLDEALKSRAAGGDYHALFAAARDSAAIAPNDEAKARALLQQVVALGRMADDGDAVARLERALGFCDEVLALQPGESMAGHAARLRGQVAQRLAPALADQAEELLRARAREWRALPAGDLDGAADMAAAFGRVIELVVRAQALGVEAVAAKLEALAEAAENLRVEATARGGETDDG